jgi:uncharacterized protein YndB with AHSA1/START domain
MSTPSIVHSTFVVERTYPAAAARVFAAFSDPTIKRRWIAEGEGWQIDEFNVDFRVGGRESSRFRFKDGPEVSNDTVYQDIVPDKRIVFGMRSRRKRISSHPSVMLSCCSISRRVLQTPRLRRDHHARLQSA